jgi:HD-GYP domain-containing protein (c-di-GMP phosphodiesterase class II)
LVTEVVDRGSVRLAELVATLSLATDLGRGEPMEHCLRQTVIALRIGERIGIGDPDRVATYYTGLLANVYCHADAHEQAEWFGDDIEVKHGAYEPGIFEFVRMIGASEKGFGRARKVAAFPGQGVALMKSMYATHTRLASEFGARIGLDEVTCRALRETYEQWDGRGGPRTLRGEEVSLAARIVQLADLTEVAYRRHGLDAARAYARKRRGKQFDPALADLFLDEADELVADIDAASSCWQEVIDAEPSLERVVSGADLDATLGAMADLVDMKSPQLSGHSRGVANLAAEAGRVSGLAENELTALRRAGFLHDLGRLGVSNSIWDKPGPLTPAETERARLHPYLTDRMLAGVPALARSRELAANHHERLDGSGYPRGIGAPQLTPADRLLAAADVYHAMTERRAHRPAKGESDAAAELRAEVRAGRLDGDAVSAVLRAAGHRVKARREWPAGLTSREVEVLGLLARGYSNKQIAQRLVITPKTVSNHLQNTYLKIDVSSRAAATHFAMQHGLVGSFEVAPDPPAR